MDVTRGGDRTAASMEEAVGYPRVDCTHESSVDHRLVLRHDHLFLLTDARGDIAPAGACGLGLFDDDTRMLSEYRLRFPGGQPALLSSEVQAMYYARIDLAVSDLDFGGDPWDPKNSIHIRRELLLGDRLIERVTLTNYLILPIEYGMELIVGCDFADIFEVRGWKREQRGTFFRPQVADRALEFAYRGRDGRVLRSRVAFTEPPTELAPRRATWRFDLEPNAAVEFAWEVLPDETEPAGARRPHELLEPRREPLDAAYREWRAECADWSTDVAAFNTTLDRAIHDLRSLYVRSGTESVITAGIPWYSTIFGRDSILASLQTLSLNPSVAIDTLRYLARHQGEREDPFTEEQPGKIMHELRRGEMARAGEIPHVPYYGTIDATPLWLVLLHETWRWTGDDALVRELLPHAERALDWIDRYGDIDGDGLVEYARTSDRGLVNQGWKDSGDGVPFPEGSLPLGPIALVEVQGYVFDAKCRMSRIFERLGRPERAASLRASADRLREQVLERFWIDELGTFALALDGEKRPIPTIASNAGHLLWSRVPDRERAARLAETLLGPDMFSGWGIRTVSAIHPVYNPMSYHNGSVWPHDNAIVVLGLAFYDEMQRALPVVQALHDAALHMEFHRLPELFCGMQRGHGHGPVQYPVSCSPQAWASGAFFMLFQALTGILPDAPDGVLHIRDPHLPEFLSELTVSRLRIGRSEVTLQFHRHRQRTLANLLRVDGEPLHVRIELT